MADTIDFTEVASAASKPSAERRRLAKLVLGQIFLASLAAFCSQLLLFDEANWYQIDFYDALVWGLVVTQVFATATFASRFRINSVESSLQIFYCFGALSAGLTMAAIAFLVIDALHSHKPVLLLLGIAGGYWVAVFVFLLAMFLQLRLALVCLQALSHLFSKARPQLGSARAAGLGKNYSMVDIFAFTGLAAVSISAYRLVLGMVTDYDSLRFVAMFYAASCIALCTYGLIQVRWAIYLKAILLVAIIFVFAIVELWLARHFRSRLARFDEGFLLWNVSVVIATAVQCKLLEHLARPNKISAREATSATRPHEL